MEHDDRIQEAATEESAEQEPVDRRAALRRIAALGGAVVAGAAVLRPDPAGAASGTMVYGNSGVGNDATTALTTLRSDNGSYTLNVLNGTSGSGLVAQSATGHAAYFRQNGGSSSLDGVRIDRYGTGSGAGLYVLSTGSGPGIRVIRSNTARTGPAVQAIQNNLGGAAYAAESAATGNAEPLFDGVHYGLGQGVQLLLKNAASSASVVKATTQGVGVAVRGTVDNVASAAQAIRGDTNGTGYAIYGQTTGDRAAIGGNGGSTARGAVLISNIAQLRLQPGTTVSHPASGQAGDLYVDVNKRLWFCKGSTSWVQLA